MKKAAQFLFFCMIFAVSTANAQIFSLKDSTNKRFGLLSNKVNISQKPTVFPIASIPANFYTSNLGFFCKKELKLEAITKIPFKFRLGSVQYNDWMEGKPNSGILKP